MTTAKANSTKSTTKQKPATEPAEKATPSKESIESLLSRVCERLDRLDSIESLLKRISDQLARGVDRPGIDLSRHI